MLQSREDYNRYLRIGKLSGSLTPSEEELFEQLLRTDANFAAAFALLKEKIPGQKLETLEKYRDNAHWSELQSRLDRPTSRRSTVRNISIAASFLVAASLCIWFFLPQEKQPPLRAIIPAGIELKLANGKVISLSDSGEIIQTEKALIHNFNNTLTYSANEAPEAGTNMLTVAPGLDYAITLSDSTEIWLNSMTKLEFPLVFANSFREIAIDGEAYIKVAKNADKPFFVHLPNATVRVTGTSFNVNTYHQDTSVVSLIEGSVTMKAAATEISLAPGKQGISSPNSLYQKSFNPEKTLSWQQGLFYFDRAPLPEIAAVIERWFNVKVVIDNSRNAGKLFVGVVNKHRPLDVLLKDLETAAEIESEIDREGILHFK